MPTTATPDEIRQLIEGKLGESRCDPRNVQVLLQETEQGTRIRLQDAKGGFLETEPTFPEDYPPHGGTSNADRGSGGLEGDQEAL